MSDQPAPADGVNVVTPNAGAQAAAATQEPQPTVPEPSDPEDAAEASLSVRRQGEQVIVFGEGFQADEALGVSIASEQGNYSIQLKADGSGHFTAYARAGADEDPFVVVRRASGALVHGPDDLPF